MRPEDRPGDEFPDRIPPRPSTIEPDPRPSTTGPDRGAPSTTGPADEVDRRLAAYAAVLAAASGAGAGRPEPLAALRRLGGLRAGLDEAERRLVEAAREQRASWAQIATALGLASRQAAEQRWVRLSGAATRDPARVRVERKRQQSVDTAFGAEISRLRAAVVTAHRQLGTEPDRDDWHPLVRLAHTTLGLAGSADPGGLYALATRAVDDLERVPAEQFGGALPDALHRLRQALDQASPASEAGRAGDTDGKLSRPD
ncbi:hypothetical protein [Plantactinospora sp. KLBMP9567]|uniref:hypothetical protein n=1 Tax=Plantactinospora sp. KLBMP9567 TaxID=3085900 RepID=UPI0029813470|nr:hypothetical protein [Plantactinospora sp. KLBMP9567]MDW5325969.1 hypothetical protein [Plantactinospora sp. KLBMP9567]